MLPRPTKIMVPGVVGSRTSHHHEQNGCIQHALLLVLYIVGEAKSISHSTRDTGENESRDLLKGRSFSA